jgi:F-box interacting protein
MATHFSNHPHLPEELIIEILLYLPIKTLLRFKSVSKNWYAILKSMSFANNHLTHTTNQANLLTHRLINDTRTFAFDIFPNEALDSSYQDRYMQWAAPSNAVIGPVNGVFCLFNGWDRVALWNPATRGFRLLPVSPPLLGRRGLGSFAHILGFGLDISSNTFKVVWILWDCGDVEPDEPVIVLVYDAITNSWRQLDGDAFNFNLDVHKSMTNTFLNGFYYWRAEEDDEGDDEDDCKRSIILSFDMVNEVFTEIEAPDMSGYPWGNLSIYNEQLALFFYTPSEAEKTIEIWVMESVGIWSKQITIGPILNIMRPLGCWKNGEIFLETTSRGLILYDPSGKKEIRGIGSWGHGQLIQLFIYNESLVSVNGGSDEDCLVKIAKIRQFFASRIDIPKIGL